MLYSWYDTRGGSSFTNSLPHIYPLIWLKDFLCWFVAPKDFILWLYCQSLSALAHQSLLTLFYFLNSGILTTILPYRLASQSSSYSGCWHILFMTLDHLCSDVWKSQTCVTQASNSDKIVLCSYCCLLSIIPAFGLVLFHSLMSQDNIIHCSSCSVPKKKNDFKSIFQKMSGYTKVKVTEEDLYLVS